jgi:glycosyltransferase involved in cell wall biosynthesis
VRILFVNHVPAVRELGAGRVQLELAEELGRLGHEVAFFTPAEAGPRRELKAGALTVPGFAFHAQRHVRAVGRSFDVVEAQQGLVTAPKVRLGLPGALVARSSGLVDFYREADRRIVRRLAPAERGRWSGRALREIEWRRSARASARSFRAADVIHVPNEDERLALSRRGLGHKVEVIPNALSQSVLRDLAGVAQGPRPDPPNVIFIASWTHRKGTADWPAIVRAAWEDEPALRFHFAGTGAGEARVRQDLGVGDDPRIAVTPSFEASRLAELLAGSTVGALPSYIEGFGLGVLETLAAGRPCIAYDVPGPRSLAGAIDPRWLVTVGDARAFGSAIAAVVARERDAPGGSAAECVTFAQGFGWRSVAEATLRLYERGLENWHSGGGAGVKAG